MKLLIEPGGGRTCCLNLSYDLALCDGFREELNPSYELVRKHPFALIKERTQTMQAASSRSVGIRNLINRDRVEPTAGPAVSAMP
jgi:hypothetical protein